MSPNNLKLAHSFSLVTVTNTLPVQADPLGFLSLNKGVAAAHGLYADAALPV